MCHFATSFEEHILPAELDFFFLVTLLYWLRGWYTLVTNRCTRIQHCKYRQWITVLPLKDTPVVYAGRLASFPLFIDVLKNLLIDRWAACFWDVGNQWKMLTVIFIKQLKTKGYIVDYYEESLELQYIYICGERLFDHYHYLILLQL